MRYDLIDEELKELKEPNSNLLKELLKDIEKEEIVKRTQSRLHHGTQSSGNLFNSSINFFRLILKTVLVVFALAL